MARLAKFQRERLSGLGGSDAASLWNIGRGCKRRLWYKKRNTAPDFPMSNDNLLRRGTALEPIAAREYAKRTGRKLYPGEFVHHQRHPELIVHVDRWTTGEDGRKQPLELKTMQREEFSRLKKTGIRDDYNLQIQWTMMVTGAFGRASWGVLWPDGFETLAFDVEQDLELATALMEDGLKFWATVENGPMPDALPPKDPRCRQCQFRIRCKGAELAALEALEAPVGEMVRDEALAPLVTEYAERKAIVEDAAALLSETEVAIKQAIGDRRKVDSGSGRAYWWTGNPGKRVSVELLRQKHPAIAADVEVPTAGKEYFRIFW